MENEVNVIYQRPWGTYQTLLLQPRYQVKLLMVQPGGRLSLQKHLHRAEHWVVVQGAPTLTIDSTTQVYQPNDSVYIPKEAVHRIENFTKEPCVLIEVQIGDYLGEDDIVRIEDVYGRAGRSLP